jgi:hypothetical protein
MNTQFTIDFRTIKRVAYLMMATLLFVAGIPLVQSGKASAAQFANRSITLSDSSPSGSSITSGVGSGTAVTYRVTFTPATNAGSMVIDFCGNNPILADACETASTTTGLVGMNASSATLTNVSGTAGGTGWTITASTTQIKLSSDGAHDMVAATPQVFTLSGITNASRTGTFYARMYSYGNGTQGTYTNVTTLGNYVDYGGTALALTNAITITARVQESLMFCVTKAAPSGWTTSHDCSDPVVAANPPTLILGHGTPTAVLDANTVDTGTVYTQLSTNATSGAIIRIRNSNLTCGGLSADNGTTCAIPAINSGNASPSAMATGTAAFGLFVSDSALGTDGIGSITPDPSYNNQTNETVPSNVYYGMETGTTGVTSAYGSDIAAATAPVYRVENTYTFAATAALTTPAGIYTANLSMIATSTF